MALSQLPHDDCRDLRSFDLAMWTFPHHGGRVDGNLASLPRFTIGMKLARIYERRSVEEGRS